jgi:hypothetical protein
LHGADLLGELMVDVELPAEALVEGLRAVDVGDGNRQASIFIGCRARS